MDPNDGRSTGRTIQIISALATAVLVAVTLVRAEPGSRAGAILIALAVAWGAAGTVADLISAGPPVAVEPPEDPDELEPVTTVSRLGDEPSAIARTTVALAAAAGPTVVVARADRVPDGLPDDVHVVEFQAPAGIGTALHEAADHVSTTGMLQVSGRAIVDGPAGRTAASHLQTGSSWVTGRAELLNRDRLGSTAREQLDAVLRRRASTIGLWLWEPDATIVRSDEIRDHPIDPAAPYGAWLRDRVRAGGRGTAVDDTLVFRCAPVSARGYWPDTVVRQRGAAADLADAAWRNGSPARARLCAAALLARALSGWSVLLWLAALVLASDGFPVQMAPVAYVGTVIAVAVLRWAGLRRATGMPLRPVADVMSAINALPGSVAATGSAIRRRVRAPRWPVPTRPLVWFALLATAASGYGLVTADPEAGGSRLVAAVSIVLLGLLWAFTVRSLVERNWERTGFRVRMHRAATLEPGGFVGTIVDGSPGGFAFEGARTGLGPGDEVELTAPTAGTSPALVLQGTVASRRRRAGSELLGVELHAIEPDAGTWAKELIAGARSAAPRRPVDTDVRAARRWTDVADRLAVGAVLVTSLVILGALVLVLLGFRPLVIRSGSMEPAYQIGDVVLVESVPADRLRVGDVATRFDDPDAADSLTHRVRSIRTDGDLVTVETRGDANESSEVFTVPGADRMGVVVARVPAIGRPLTLVRTSGGWLAVGLGLMAVFVALLVVPRAVRHRRRKRRPADDDDQTVASSSSTSSP